MVTGFEQFAVGQVFTSAACTIDGAAIKAFAAQFDFQPQHIGEEAAVRSLAGTLVASGWHTASLTMRLMLESALGGVAGRALGLKISEITWPILVHPGDQLYAVSEVLEVRPSRSKPDRGIVVMRTTTYNQHAQAAQEMTGTLMILRSDAELKPVHSAA